MIVVTGAAGFIGSCIVSALNARGLNDLILVDHMDGDDDPKQANLKNKKFKKFYDKQDFLNLICNDDIEDDIEAILHMGACSSTTLTDADYYQKNNFEYSVHMAKWALKKKSRFIYASSAATYGDGSLGYKDDVDSIFNCKPLNLYGLSKQKFDQWVVENNLLDQMVGLKFFNVFGPNEYHKADMRSVIAKAHDRVDEEGKMMLFKSFVPEYEDGGQKRDFIYVKDVLDVIMYFYDHHAINGIFNVGTGQARTWNDLAKSLFAALQKPVNIEYKDMPGSLQKGYQNFTQADAENLRKCGYTKEFTSLENAIADYSSYLKEKKYY